MDNTKVSMPCPRCGMKHAASEYKPQPERLQEQIEKAGKRGYHGVPYGPDDVECSCGAKLRHVVPLFKVAEPGWYWKIL